MAQWAGQYSGRTHATKVQALESTLRVAIESLNASAGPELSRKRKAVERLAARLLSARLHLLKARIAATSDLNAESQIDALGARADLVQEQGVPGILEEFGIGSEYDSAAVREPD